jgi:hypothetical protein
MSWVPVAIAFLVAGVLELCFGMFSIVGTLTGVGLSALLLADSPAGQIGWVGPVVGIIYGVWCVASLVAGSLHCVAGVQFLRGVKSRKLLWAGTIASLLPIVTVYCGVTALVAGILGLVTALMPERGATES